MPGPLFNFSAFLGAVSGAMPGGILGFLGLFGPGIMLIYAFMPFWEAARQYAWVRCGLVGMNAASIGLVFAACVTLFNKYCKNSAEGAVMLISMVLVKRFKIWPPVAIFGCAALCLVLFFLDVHGAGGDWCHVAKYGDFSTQDVSRCGEVASTLRTISHVPSAEPRRPTVREARRPLVCHSPSSQLARCGLARTVCVRTCGVFLWG